MTNGRETSVQPYHQQPGDGDGDGERPVSSPIISSQVMEMEMVRDQCPAPSSAAG